MKFSFWRRLWHWRRYRAIRRRRRAAAVTADEKELAATTILNIDSAFEEQTADLGVAPFWETDFAKRYEEICQIACGGVGCVSKARDRVFDRIVAVKALREQFQNDPRAIAGFKEECCLNARLDHPAIVPVYSLGFSAEHHPAVAMKLINGSSLHEFLLNLRSAYQTRRVRPGQEHLALLSRLEFFLKICEAVEYCHSRRIVHGDLKPDNILLGPYGELYVMDWGCARPAGAKLQSISGTPNYLPPEFFKTHIVNEQIDIYALGMVLFEIVTLQRGSNGRDSGGASGFCNVNKREDYRHFIAPLKVNERIRAIIQKAVAPDPARRYATVRALSDDVRRFCYDREISAAPDHLLRKVFRFIYLKRAWSLTVAVLLLGIFCAAVLYGFYRDVTREHQRDLVLVRRLKLQAVTDLLGFQLERRVLFSHGQLIRFGDGLLNASPDAGAFERVARKMADQFAALPSGLPPVPPFRPERRSWERLIMLWPDRSQSFYPAPSEQTRLPEACFAALAPDRITWSRPYLMSAANYRVLCRLPLCRDDGTALGVAGLEVALEQMVEPLLAVNRNDAHYLYVVSADEAVFAVGPDGIALLRGEEAPYGFSRYDLLTLAGQMAAQQLQQQEIWRGKHSYVVAGTSIPSIDALLLQIMDSKTLANHVHRD